MRFLPWLLLAGVAVALYLRSSPEPAASREEAAPQVQVGAGGGLDLVATVAPAGDGRRIRLRSARGAAVVVLDPPRGEGIAFGDGRFEPADAAEGARFVADVAEWLGAPAPRARPGELGSFGFSYARLGRNAGWEANKLFLEFDGRYAEVYFNLAPDGARARLLEKDEEYAADLLAVLAIAVRDGTPPRRSTATDPHFASDEPWLAGARKLACDGKFDTGAWMSEGLLGVLGNRPARLVLWRDPGAAAKPLGALPGVVTALVPSPAGDAVAVVVVHPASPDFSSSEDPAELFVMPKGPPRSLLSSTPEFRLMSGPGLAWSPDGARLAVSAPVEGPPPRRSRTRVLEVASGEVQAETAVELDLDVEAWTGEGLTLRRTEFDADFNLSVKHFRWSPGAGDPVAIASPGWIVSPDGRYTVEPREDGVVSVRGPEDERTFVSADAGDREYLAALRENAPVWCGPHHLVVPGGDEVILDLATLKLQLLLPDRGWRLGPVSRDGNRAVCLDPGGAPHWHER